MADDSTDPFVMVDAPSGRKSNASRCSVSNSTTPPASEWVLLDDPNIPTDEELQRQAAIAKVEAEMLAKLRLLRERDALIEQREAISQQPEMSFPDLPSQVLKVAAQAEAESELRLMQKGRAEELVSAELLERAKQEALAVKRSEVDHLGPRCNCLGASIGHHRPACRFGVASK